MLDLSHRFCWQVESKYVALANRILDHLGMNCKWVKQKMTNLLVSEEIECKGEIYRLGIRDQLIDQRFQFALNGQV